MKHSSVGWLVTGVCVVVCVVAHNARSNRLESLSPKIARLQEIQQEAKQVERQSNENLQVWASHQAEVDDKNSWSSLISTGVRSFFDGFTFGAFTDEGAFSESKKFDRWKTDFSKREAVRAEQARQIAAAFQNLQDEDKRLRVAASKEYDQFKLFNNLRTWFGLIGIGAAIFAWVSASKEKCAQENERSVASEVR